MTDTRFGIALSAPHGGGGGKLFYDDAMRIEGALYHAPCWPPPETINVNGMTYRRISYSQITDEREDMTHVFRGAEYRLADGEKTEDCVSGRCFW